MVVQQFIRDTVCTCSKLWGSEGSMVRVDPWRWQAARAATQLDSGPRETCQVQEMLTAAPNLLEERLSALSHGSKEHSRGAVLFLESACMRLQTKNYGVGHDGPPWLESLAVVGFWEKKAILLWEISHIPMEGHTSKYLASTNWPWCLQG